MDKPRPPGASLPLSQLLQSRGVGIDSYDQAVVCEGRNKSAIARARQSDSPSRPVAFVCEGRCRWAIAKARARAPFHLSSEFTEAAENAEKNRIRPLPPRRLRVLRWLRELSDFRNRRAGNPLAPRHVAYAIFLRSLLVGVTTRSVQNRTLSRLTAPHCPFANERLCMTCTRAAESREFPFETLLQ